MKEEEKSPFAMNMKKARELRGWTQEVASQRMGIHRSTVGAYEEDRAKPNVDGLERILNTYCVKDWKTFITSYVYFDRPRHKPFPPSAIERRYDALNGDDKRIVDMLLFKKTPSHTLSQH
jgi:transcriptional regulator with XRE-family HTH domain